MCPYGHIVFLYYVSVRTKGFLAVSVKKSQNLSKKSKMPKKILKHKNKIKNVKLVLFFSSKFKFKSQLSFHFNIFIIILPKKEGKFTRMK